MKFIINYTYEDGLQDSETINLECDHPKKVLDAYIKEMVNRDNSHIDKADVVQVEEVNIASYTNIKSELFNRMILLIHKRPSMSHLHIIKHFKTNNNVDVDVETLHNMLTGMVNAQYIVYNSIAGTYSLTDTGFDHHRNLTKQ